MTTRLVHIIPALAQDGTQNQLMLLAAHLPRGDVDVHVCAMTPAGPEARHELRRQGVRVHTTGNSRRIAPSDFIRLRHLIRSLRPDIVQTWGFSASTWGSLLVRLSGVERLIATGACHDQAPPWHGAVWKRYIARSAQRIVVPDVATRQVLVSQGLAAEKLAVIPRAVLPVAADVVSRREELLKDLRIQLDSRLIGTVGPLTPWNRIKDLIWTTDLLNIVRDDIHLLILGDGPNRWRLERFRDNVRIGHRVHFLGRRDDWPGLIPQLDCFWLSSDRGNQTSGIMEAMAAGVPVVATDISANRDLIRPGRTGYLYPVGNRGILARRTYQLFKDGDTSRRVGAAGRQRVLAEFNVEKMVQRYMTLYDDVMRDSA